MAGNKPGRRKKVLIDRDFQLRFIWRLAGILFFYLLVFLMISVVAPVGFTLVGSPPEWALMETAFRVEVLMNLVLVPMICTYLCLFVHGVLETFRVAGPNYRFRAVFKDLARGVLPRGVAIRQKDYLQDTAGDMNAALIHVHDQVAQLRRLGQEAKQHQAAGSDELAGSIEQMNELLSKFQMVTAAPACQPILEGEQPAEAIAEPVETA